MKFEKIHNKGQARIFNNKYLEALTKAHPLTIWAMYLPLSAWLMYYGSNRFAFEAWRIMLFFIGGMLVWTFFEYIMHRFLFHHLSENKWGQRMVYIIHGNHHHYPRDQERLFMPPLPSLIFASVIFLLMYLIMGNFVFIFFPGFVVGYLLYGTMHFAIHAWNPPFKWMKPLWRNHHLHHYKDDSKGYGVSTTLWDRVFGTMFDEKKDDH